MTAIVVVRPNTALWARLARIITEHKPWNRVSLTTDVLAMTGLPTGSDANTDVARVGRAALVSTYIGETEKNLAALRDRAEASSWILLFDEADALFGKRTSVTDAHDRYANQEVSYVMDRAELDRYILIARARTRRWPRPRVRWQNRGDQNGGGSNSASVAKRTGPAGWSQ